MFLHRGGYVSYSSKRLQQLTWWSNLKQIMIILPPLSWTNPILNFIHCGDNNPAYLPAGYSDLARSNARECSERLCTAHWWWSPVAQRTRANHWMLSKTYLLWLPHVVSNPYVVHSNALTWPNDLPFHLSKPARVFKLGKGEGCLMLSSLRMVQRAMPWTMKTHMMSCGIFSLVIVTSLDNNSHACLGIRIEKYIGNLRQTHVLYCIILILMFQNICSNLFCYTYQFSWRSTPALYSHTMSSQDSLRPFPWPRSRSPKRRFECSKPTPHQTSADVEATDGASALVSRTSPTPTLRPFANRISNSAYLTTGCNDDSFLHYMLPPQGATAGKVLCHCKSTMMSLFARHDPMIFKIGYTHNPFWRWSNNIYGYKFDKINKWTHMVILYKSTEPFGPAMLEASLIDMFQSISSFCVPENFMVA